MTETKHTPSSPRPWTNLQDTWILDRNASTVVHGTMARSDADLIAAAPDLLEAAIEAYVFLDDIYGHASAPYIGAAHHAIDALRAAIAKAEGRES